MERKFRPKRQGPVIITVNRLGLEISPKIINITDGPERIRRLIAKKINIADIPNPEQKSDYDNRKKQIPG